MNDQKFAIFLSFYNFDKNRKTVHLSITMGSILEAILFSSIRAQFCLDFIHVHMTRQCLYNLKNQKILQKDTSSAP